MADTEQGGTATETGAQTEVKEDNGGKKLDHREEGQPVPYSRFQEVNEKRKAAEETLAAIVDDLCADVPENMRELIPNLPAAEKVKWLREAKKRGLFAGTRAQTESSPDAKRPTSKPSEDLGSLSPVDMMARGYK